MLLLLLLLFAIVVAVVVAIVVAVVVVAIVAVAVTGFCKTHTSIKKCVYHLVALCQRWGWSGSRGVVGGEGDIW